MTKWVTLFCVVATFFAIATLIYIVIEGIIKGVKRKKEERRAYNQTNQTLLRTEGVLLITGLLCAASGFLIGHAIAKDREKPSKSPFKE